MLLSFFSTYKWVHDFTRACHLHADIHGRCIPGCMKAVGETAAELTVFAPPTWVFAWRRARAQMVQQREPLSAGALSLWPALWLLPGLPAAPRQCVCVCVCLCTIPFCVSPCLCLFLCVWHYGNTASPLMAASGNSRQGLQWHWHTTQVHVWCEWNLLHSCCWHGVN